MYIDESVKIDKDGLPLDLVNEINLMDSLYANKREALFYLKLNEIYAMAKTYMLSDYIDGVTCEKIWKRYGVA